MAKLRIEDANGDLLVDGYVKFIENLFDPDPDNSFQNYEDYSSENENRRANRLQDFVRGYGVIQQEKANGDLEDISNNNCRVEGVKDEKRHGPRSRVTVPIPPEPVTDFTYLDDYAKKIHELYSADEFDRCYKFMLGVMLLTRCR